MNSSNYEHLDEILAEKVTRTRRKNNKKNEKDGASRGFSGFITEEILYTLTEIC